MISKEQQIDLIEEKARCKHCGKKMVSSWWITTNGYCYHCGMLGFSYLRERVCAHIVYYFNIVYWIFCRLSKEDK